MSETRPDRRPVVLLVEDDELFARSLVRLLGRRCELVVAANLATALACIEVGQLDAILCDWNLGEMTGAPALLHCARIHPHARRIVMSGRSPEEIVPLVPSGLVHAYLPKPSPMAEILRAVGLDEP